MATKKEVEQDVTDIFGLQCKLIKAQLEAIEKLPPEEQLEALGAPRLAAISKFIKDQEIRIRLSDDESASELSDTLDSITNDVNEIRNSKTIKFAQ